MRIIKNVMILASMASFTASTNAATIVGDFIAVDFGATAPATANFNVINAGTSSLASLVEFNTGAATSVGLSVTGFTGNNANGSAGNFGNTTDATVFADGILASGTAGGDVLVFTFTGLDDSFTYDLFAGTARTVGNIPNFVADFEVNGTVLNSDATPTGGLVQFTGLTSTNGVLTLTATEAQALVAVSQLGLTVASVPEPSSTALLGLGLIGIFARRRQRA